MFMTGHSKIILFHSIDLNGGLGRDYNCILALNTMKEMIGMGMLTWFSIRNMLSSTKKVIVSFPMSGYVVRGGRTEYDPHF